MESVRRHGKPAFGDNIKRVFRTMLTLIVMSMAIALGTHDMMSDTYAAERRYITEQTILFSE